MEVVKVVRVIVTFDVHSQKVNRDITKILKANGFRIQNSVYEINIYKSDIDKLSQKLQAVINNNIDSCVIYNLGKNIEDRIIRLGRQQDTYVSLLCNGYIIL